MAPFSLIPESSSNGERFDALRPQLPIRWHSSPAGITSSVASNVGPRIGSRSFRQGIYWILAGYHSRHHSTPQHCAREANASVGPKHGPASRPGSRTAQHIAAAQGGPCGTRRGSADGSAHKSPYVRAGEATDRPSDSSSNCPTHEASGKANRCRLQHSTSSSSGLSGTDPTIYGAKDPSSKRDITTGRYEGYGSGNRPEELAPEGMSGRIHIM